jgi:Ca2+-binding RTX toxin-like protein
VLGGAGDDVFAPEFDGDDDSVNGGLGNDVIGPSAFSSQPPPEVGSFVADADSISGPGWGDDDVLGINSINVRGTTGDDTFDASAWTATVALAGSGGDDTILGPARGSMLQGGADDDTVMGGDEPDTIDGGGVGVAVSGTDSLTGGGEDDSFVADGEDTVVGGNGTDSVDAVAFGDEVVAIDAGITASTPLVPDAVMPFTSVERLDLDALNPVAGAGTLADVSAFSTDRVELLTGDGPDTLVGSAGDDILNAGAGTDLLLATRPGGTLLDDELLSGTESDSLQGIERASLTGTSGGDAFDASAFTAGPVTLLGLDGDDTLRGGSGGDSLVGGGGVDEFFANAGNDVLRAADGIAEAVVNCGAGADTPDADAADTLNADCDVPAPPGAGGGGGGGGALSPPPAAAPSPAPAPAPAPQPAPRAPLARLPAFTRIATLPSARRCVSRRSFRIRLRQPSGPRVVSATVTVNGRRVQVVRGARLTVPVNLRGLPRGRFTVRIVLTLADGRKVSGSRRYRTCAPRRRR